MGEFVLPDKFVRWAYDGRAELVRRQAQGDQVSRDEVFLGFTRHTPTFISNGSAGLNGSIKGVGFIPKAEYLDEVLDAYLEHIEGGWRDGYSEEGLQLLTKYMWGEGCKDRIDFSILGSIELALKHSWTNYLENPEVTLVYYQPPAITYEVRGKMEIHRDGKYHKFINAQHDVYHKPNTDLWQKRPVYVIHIEEIFDNSVGPNAFGTKIL